MQDRTSKQLLREPRPASPGDWSRLSADIAAECLRSNQPVALVNSLYNRFRDELGLQCYCQYRFERRSQQAVLVSYDGLSQTGAEGIERFAVSADLQAALEHGPLLLTEQNAPATLIEHLGHLIAEAACLCCPLYVGGRMAGVLLFGTKDGLAFEPAAQSMLTALGYQVSSALERMRLRSQLEVERERFQALMDHIPGAVLLAEAPSGRVVAGNVRAEKILAGLDAGSALPADDPLSRARRGEVVRGAEYRYESPDEQHSWIRVSGSPVRDRSGLTVGSVITCYDISKEKQAEQALRDSEQRFRQLANATPQIVWAAEPDGRVYYFNRRWFEYCNLDEATSYTAEGWMTVIEPEDRSEVQATWRRAIAAGEPFELECRLSCGSTGECRWHLLRALPFRGDSGVIARWLGTATDIHEQKQAEELLRAADRHKDEFLAMLGHELRNPLAAVANALALMEFSDVSVEETQHCRQIISRQITTMTRLIDDLLDVARVTQRKIALQKERVNLAELVERASATARPTIDARRHRLHLDCDAPLWIECDPTRIEQVLVNLLQNAAKYTEPGGDIWISAAGEEAGAAVRVRDTGIGMTAEMLSQAFDLFTQAERSLDRAQGGLGIGLTMVKNLVGMHGGRVSATSQGLGNGCEFTVWLPLAPNGGADSQRADAAQEAGGPRPLRKRVLIVEDNADSADSLGLLLKRWGCSVEVVYDGALALETAARFRPEIVLLDLGLPRMDGYEIARRLRLQPEGQAATLIALTGYGRFEDQQRSLEAGFQQHLTKPVKPAALRALLED